MHFAIEHITSYRYAAPVFLEPHILRLRPASDAHQTLLEYTMEIDPEPAGRSDLVDLDGATTTAIWFDDSTDHLTIRTSSEVTTHLGNPFDYLWTGGDSLPLIYEAEMAGRLAVYRAAPDADEAVRCLGDEVVRACEGNPQRFPTLLASTLHARCKQEFRPSGAPLQPGETLRRGEGSCRDLAVLYLAVARGCGFAGRFVSGFHAQGGVDQHELHAWAEVYLPGGGWRGFDPSTGFAVADTYISIAAAPLAVDAAPVSGSYRGRSYGGEPEATVRIERLFPSDS